MAPPLANEVATPISQAKVHIVKPPRITAHVSAIAESINAIFARLMRLDLMTGSIRAATPTITTAIGTVTTMATGTVTTMAIGTVTTMATGIAITETGIETIAADATGIVTTTTAAHLICDRQR